MTPDMTPDEYLAHYTAALEKKRFWALLDAINLEAKFQMFLSMYQPIKRMGTHWDPCAERTWFFTQTGDTNDD